MLNTLNIYLNHINKNAPVYSQKNVNRGGVVSCNIKELYQILLE